MVLAQDGQRGVAGAGEAMGQGDGHSFRGRSRIGHGGGCRPRVLWSTFVEHAGPPGLTDERSIASRPTGAHQACTPARRESHRTHLHSAVHRGWRHGALAQCVRAARRCGLRCFSSFAFPMRTPNEAAAATSCRAASPRGSPFRFRRCAQQSPLALRCTAVAPCSWRAWKTPCWSVAAQASFVLRDGQGPRSRGDSLQSAPPRRARRRRSRCLSPSARSPGGPTCCSPAS